MSTKMHLTITIFNLKLNVPSLIHCIYVFVLLPVIIIKIIFYISFLFY